MNPSRPVTKRKDEGMIDLEKLRQEEFKELTIDEQMEIKK